jgi:hypothetical protein
VASSLLYLILAAASAAGADAAGADPPAERWSEPLRVRITNAYPGLSNQLEALGFDLVYEFDEPVEVLARPGDLERLAALGLEVLVIDRDLFPGARGHSLEGNLDPEYHTYLEMLTELEALAADYPGICRLYDLGDAESKNYIWSNYSHSYDIWGLRISDNPGQEEPEPCVVYDGRHHAREPVSTEICMALAQHFCVNYGIDPTVTELVDSTEIWVVPMINPDGHQWVEDVDPWWRKTLYDHNENHFVDPDEGIDPNRNYDWHWASGNWWSQTYGGPEPWRAPEVAAMRDLHLAHRTALNATYHSHGEVTLYPFGYGVIAEPAVVDIACQFASLIGYTCRQSGTLNGTSKDWVYGAIGGAAFTVETATEFIPTGPEMQAIVTAILPGSTWLVARAHGPSVQGTVTDATSGAPLLARIAIPEIQNNWGNGELEDMWTEAATGYYCRMRPAAQEAITLQVSADGYEPRQVVVTTGGPDATIANIELTPITVSVAADAGAGPSAATRLEPGFPNPFNPSTRLPFVLAREEEVTIAVHDLTGRRVRTLVRGRMAPGNHETSWDGTDEAGNRLASGIYLCRMETGAESHSIRLALLK